MLRFSVKISFDVFDSNDFFSVELKRFLLQTGWYSLRKMLRRKLPYMNSPFEIKFEFPLAHSDLAVSLRATVTVHHSDLYYVVDNFHFAGINYRQRELALLPVQEIQKVRRGDVEIWVHKESHCESQLSIALGRAIEKAGI